MVFLDMVHRKKHNGENRYQLMKLIVSSKEDPASMNILNNLLGQDWDEVGDYLGNQVYRKRNFLSVTTNRHHIYENRIDQKVSNDFNLDIDQVIFISKHASEAGINSLTVHPIGNLGEAKYGGEDGKLVPTSPFDMTMALRILKKFHSRDHAVSGYDVSFEATHHGPYLETPTFYIEIGSDKEQWKDEKAGAVIAKIVMDLEGLSEKKYPVIVCIGGGHYAPRFTELALEKKVSIGHMVPGWGLKFLTPTSFIRLIENTPKAEYVYFDRSSTKGKERKRIKRWIKEKDMDLEVVRSKDIDDL